MTMKEGTNLHELTTLLELLRQYKVKSYSDKQYNLEFLPEEPEWLGESDESDQTGLVEIPYHSEN